MFTATVRLPLLLSLVLALTLSTTACKSGSTKPSIAQTVSEVRCKQAQDAKLPALPRADEWIVCYPALPGALNPREACVLSESGVTWVGAAAVVVEKLRGYRKVEHACLDEAEAKGLIQQ